MAFAIRVQYRTMSLTMGMLVCLLLPATARGDGAPGAPLEGPLFRAVMTMTDSRLSELEYDATMHFGVEGQPLPAATDGVTIAILDSGAGTHLVGYPDSVALGLSGSYLTANSFSAGGIGGLVDVGISQPVGFFACGLQHYLGATNVPSAFMVGQANFSCGVNTYENHAASNIVPTVLGAPFLAFFAASIRNDQPCVIHHNGKRVWSPAITFYDDPLDPALTQLAHRVFMAVTPSSSLTVQYIAWLNDNDEFEPIVPSVIGGGASLFFTASSMTFSNNGSQTAGKVMIDTAAQATLISEIAAAELGLNLNEKEFEIEVQGVAGTIIAPGFYIDEVRIPALGGALVWTNVPVIVVNVASPEGGTLFGILGTNLFATRNLVFNGIASTPYLDVSDPVVSPAMQITAMRRKSEYEYEVEWLAEPAPPVMTVERCSDLTADPPVWTVVATGDLATMTGAMSVPDPSLPTAFFRLMGR